MASDAPQSTAGPPSAAKPAGRLRLALRAVRHAPKHVRAVYPWAKAHRLKALVALAGVSLLLGTAALLLVLFVPGDDTADESSDPAAALAALDAGQLDVAKETADSLNDSLPEHQSVQAFVYGAIAAQQAARTRDPEPRRKHIAAAAEHLDRARSLKFPAGRELQGSTLLGSNLIERGHFLAALPVLAEALKLADPESGSSPSAQRELHRWMALALRRAPNPDNQQALKYLDRLLAVKDLPAAEREQALLGKAEALLRLGQHEACQAMLNNLAADAAGSAAALILKGRLAMARAEQLASPALGSAPLKSPTSASAIESSVVELSRSRFAPAVRFFQAALKADLEKQEPTRQAVYLMGVCRQRLGDARGALGDFDRVNRQFGETPEASAANLEQAEIYRRQTDDEQAGAAYRRAIIAAGSRETFSNPFLTLEEFQARVVAAYRDYLSSKKFTEAIALTESMAPLLSREQSLRLGARTRELWAAELSTAAVGQPSGKAAPQLGQARSHLRAAGSIFVELAQLGDDPNRQMDDRWHAARNFLAGQDYTHAVTQLTEYLNGTARTRRQLALVALGEAQLALGNADAALDALLGCMERYPNDSTAYRARLLAGKAYMERGDMTQAEELLRRNLTGPLRPDSAEWRASLFSMGYLAFLVGSRLDAEARSSELGGEPKQAETARKLELAVAQFGLAAAKLDEALQRYPEDPAIVHCKYLLAESLRLTTKLPRARLVKVTIEATRTALTRQIQEAADAALGHYAELIEQLNRRQENDPLSPLEKSILRNAYFAQAGVYYDLGQYDQAIAAYKAAANRYQNQPEALDAYFQLAACYRRLNRIQDARGTLEQAKVVLARMNASDVAFGQTTSHTKPEWERLLDWLIKL